MMKIAWYVTRPTTTVTPPNAISKRPQAVAGGELGGGGVLDGEVGGDRHVRVARVDVEAGEHAEGDPGGDQPDGARQPVLRGAVRDRGDDRDDGGADEELVTGGEHWSVAHLVT